MLHELRPFAWQSPAEREPKWIACMNEPDLQAKPAPAETGRPLPFPPQGKKCLVDPKVDNPISAACC